MHITTHETIPRATEMTLRAKPLTIFLSKRVELRIDRGDRLKDVAAVVRKHWRLDSATCASVVAYWFAIGERVASGKKRGGWAKTEVDTSPRRRYLR